MSVPTIAERKTALRWPRRRAGAEAEVHQVLDWYFNNVYSKREGPGAVPYYCDPDRVGALAVRDSDLAAGRDGALFRLFVAMSMFQALRDVVIMRQQRAFAPSAVRSIANEGFVKRSIARHDCPALISIEAFEEGCDVVKTGDVVDCGRSQGLPCHVKAATVAFNRMGDMGKLPTSAWLRHWKDGGVRKILDDVGRDEESPTKRAALLVQRFALVHRVGRKLSTMFVSALSTPALAPGLTPWFPDIDGNELVVVDTNVARAVDALRMPGAARTYDAREQWVRERAAQLDLREFHPDVPSYSPRLVQQALYAFCSKSNRVARDDGCAGIDAACGSCAPSLCPFVASASSPCRRA